MPIELRCLGQIELHGLDAGAADGVLTRQRQLALLASLLLAGPRTGVRRDTLVSRFWPEVTEARGRGSLRVALHGLRRHLGAGAIRSRGDDLLIDPAMLTCDVHAFEGRIATRRYEDALTLYGGELLPGLRIRGAPGFDAWLTARRSELRRAASEAAWALVADAERLGRIVEAAERARRAADLTPNDEPALRRLLRVLERAGDRVGALHAYDEFAARWSSERGVGPSPETRTLAEAIGAVAPPAASAARAAVRAPPARVAVDTWPRAGRIAVLPFLVEGGSAQADPIASGLGHEVIASLTRISGILVVARTSAERYRARERRRFREIGRDLGVDTILDASVRPLGGRLALVARLVDARSETPVWAEVYEFAPMEVLEVRTRLVVELFAALRIDLTFEEEERLASAPTSSASAYLAYLEGRAHWAQRSRDGLEAAIERFETALTIDPGLALAWAGLADAYLTLFPAAGIRTAEARVLAREAARRALSLDARLGEAHATLGLLRAVLDRDFDGAEEDLRRACELSPGHATAHHWTGAFLAFVKRRPDEAEAELAIARQLDPFSPIIHNDIGLARLNRGDIEGARTSFARALELDPGFWRSHYDLGITLCVAGQPEEGVAHLRRAWRQGAYGADLDAVSAREDASEGWRDSLDRKLRELRAGRTEEGPHPMEAALMSILLGRREEALHWLRIVFDGGPVALVMGYYPAFAPLEGDPAFRELLESAGISVST